MDLILKIVVGLIIGIVSGYLIDKISKNIINSDSERIKDYKLDKRMIITGTVILSVANIFKFNYLGFIHYGIVALILILIGIIDHYTHYVYLIISIPTVILSLALGMYFNGISSLIIQIPVFLVLFIIAYFSNKFYGDLEAMAIISLIVGVFGMMILVLVSSFLTIPELIKNRKRENYSVAFCTYLALSYSIILILI